MTAIVSQACSFMFLHIFYILVMHQVLNMHTNTFVTNHSKIKVNYVMLTVLDQCVMNEIYVF